MRLSWRYHRYCVGGIWGGGPWEAWEPLLDTHVDSTLRILVSWRRWTDISRYARAAFPVRGLWESTPRHALDEASQLGFGGGV